MRKYLIENVSNEMQSFHGHALGKVRGGRKGGSIWLMEAEYSTVQVQARLASGVVVLVKAIPPLPVEPIAEPIEDISVDTSPAAPVQEVTIEEEVQAEESIIEDSQPESSVEESIDLSSLTTSELRAMLKEKGLYDSSLRKKAQMIKVLEASNED